MHLLLDLLPHNMPPAGPAALDPALRPRAARLYELYTSDRPSLARAAVKVAQVRAPDSERTVSGAASVVSLSRPAPTQHNSPPEAVFIDVCGQHGQPRTAWQVPHSAPCCPGHTLAHERQHPDTSYCDRQGYDLLADEVGGPAGLAAYVGRLMDGTASQQNLTPAIGLITHFKVVAATNHSQGT